MYTVNQNSKIIMTYVQSYNQDEEIFYVDYNKSMSFENEDALVLFLARCINDHFSRCDYLDDQLLCPTDVTLDYNEYGDVTYKESKHYWFHTKDNRTIDIRPYYKQAEKMVMDYKNGLIDDLSQPYYTRRRYYRGRKHYTVTRGRCVHYFSNLKKSYIDQDFDLSHYHIKNDKLKSWSIYGWSRKSCGWKDKKYRKQWMHNAVEKEFHEKNKAKKYI